MRQILILLALAAILAGCTPHRIPIQQGNIVSHERLALIKPGMDTRQVRTALGSPLVVDPFHPDRWDYFYSLEKKGELTATYLVTLHFEQNTLLRVEHKGAIPESERAALELVSNKGERIRAQ